MKKTYLLILLLGLPTLSVANSAIRTNDQLISAGDSLKTLYLLWGKPQYSVRSEKTCNKILKLKKRKCSTSRKVWLKDDMYWLVQHQGDLIIKIDWTRFESKLTEKI